MAKVSLLLAECFWPKWKLGFDLLHNTNAFLIILLSASIQAHMFVDILFMKSVFSILEIIQLVACDWQLKSEEKKFFW